jgi:hypothetical protein
VSKKRDARIKHQVARVVALRTVYSLLMELLNEAAKRNATGVKHSWKQLHEDQRRVETLKERYPHLSSGLFAEFDKHFAELEERLHAADRLKGER